MEELIDKGLKNIGKKQRGNGSFAVFSSSKIDDFAGSRCYDTTFANALLLMILDGVSGGQVEYIKRGLSRYLVGQKFDNWQFNYWDRKSKEYQSHRVPNDLDDTFVVLAALQLCDKNIFKPGDFAQITNILVMAEQKEGGPYRTWLVPQDFDQKWLDVDVAVNANVAFWLKINEITLPNLMEFFEDKIKNKDLGSKYYPSYFPVIYYLSRFYDGRYQNILIDWLFDNRTRDGGWGNELVTALAITALLNMGVRRDELRISGKWLVGRQNRGWWPAVGFCLDPALEKRKYYAGSDVLTTAFCLEALSKLRMTNDELRKKSKFIILRNNVQNSGKNKYADFYKNVVDDIRRDFGKLGEGLREDCVRFLDEMVKKDEDMEIGLLPKVVADSLVKKVDKKFIGEVCRGSIYGWMAYTLYDNYLDYEVESWMLPVANICFLKLHRVYSDLGSEKLLQMHSDLIIRMEAANSWEVNNCRIDIGKRIYKKDLPHFGDLGVIADKSIGHGLGPLVVVAGAGGSPADVRNFLKFFQLYLVARQLNDDAHDWVDDLRNGHINAAGAIGLEKWFGVRKLRKSFDLKKDLGDLEVVFWEKSINKISEKIWWTTGEAKKVIKKVKVIGFFDFYLSRLTRLDRAAERAVEEAAGVKEFINNY
ncbi:hypothetical protein KJ855_03125 [Patescibacteria group bacterium]|nr:hypothetical protein [Patescibacteria group bacterium]